MQSVKWRNEIVLPNPSLKGYLNRVVTGFKDEGRTTFYKNQDVQKVVDRWVNHLEPLKVKYPSLWEFEIDLRRKVGPRSFMAPLSERMEAVRSYYDSISLDQAEISADAVAAVLREFSQARGLNIRSQKNTLQHMKISTNSGSPYFRKKSSVIKETVPCQTWMQGDYCYQLLSQDRNRFDAAAILGWRGQEGGPTDADTKQRVVWMFPFAVNVRELQMYQPFIEIGQHYNLVPAWNGNEAVDKRITALFDTKRSSDLIVCTDFSAFDQHFNTSMQIATRQVLEGILAKNPESEKWLDEIFPIKYQIPLITKWDSMIIGKHGLGSGSGGTNVDGTIGHRILQHEAALSKGKLLNPNSMCLGDDGILTYPGISVDDVVQSYTRHGMEMNVSKQYASKDECVYLRCWHHRKYRVNNVCVGVYSTCRALGKLLETERSTAAFSKTDIALRQLSILENIRYHPMKEEFVDFCIKGDQYRLGIDIPGFLDNISSIARKSMDVIQNTLSYAAQYEISSKGAGGISDWWVVKYLLAKRDAELKRSASR